MELTGFCFEVINQENVLEFAIILVTWLQLTILTRLQRVTLIDVILCTTGRSVVILPEVGLAGNVSRNAIVITTRRVLYVESSRQCTNQRASAILPRDYIPVNR